MADPVRLYYKGRNRFEQADVAVPNDAGPGGGAEAPAHLDHVSPASVLTADVKEQMQDGGLSDHLTGAQTVYHLRAGDIVALPAAHAAWLLNHPVYRHLFRQTDDPARPAVDAVDVGHHP